MIIYPDDENKPPVGSDLNRRAEVTLDQVWPQDKTQREPIKDRERLDAMDYQGKLRRVCDKHDMRFVDYRPETGSWVFRVDHFSKYGLNDSDDEDEFVAVDPKKAKLQAEAAQAAGTDKDVGIRTEIQLFVFAHILFCSNCSSVSLRSSLDSRKPPNRRRRTRNQ